MLVSKVIWDDTIQINRGVSSHNMFQLHRDEVSQMEKEMCQYLEWELNVDPVTLQEFEEMVKKDFVGPGPYSTYYILPTSPKIVYESFPSSADR